MSDLNSRLALLVTLLLVPAPGAMADPVAEFYKDKTVFLQIGSAVGGIYDVVGRIFARHIGRHIPGNPKVIPQNVPGGGSLQLANQFNSITPRDGTHFGVFNNGMPTTPLLDPKAARYDPRKFHFLGSPSRESHILVTWHTSPIKTIDDLFTKEVIAGATAPGAAPHDFPQLTNALIGTRFKIVRGYKGGHDTNLAMQRGEIHANAGIAWSSAKTDYPDALANKQLLVIAGFGFKKHPELEHVPLLPTGKTVEDRQLFELMYARQAYGRPFAMPADVPLPRVNALRAALTATMTDPEFLVDAKRANLELDPVSADELTELTERIFKTPDAVLQRMQQVLNAK